MSWSNKCTLINSIFIKYEESKIKFHFIILEVIFKLKKFESKLYFKMFLLWSITSKVYQNKYKLQSNWTKVLFVKNQAWSLLNQTWKTSFFLILLPYSTLSSPSCDFKRILVFENFLAKYFTQKNYIFELTAN